MDKKALPKEFSDKWHLFTDGACSGNPGPGGWAAVVIGGGRLIELGGGEKETTNNRMEMNAALEALLKVPQGERAVIRSDSSYLTNGITKWIFGWKKNGWKKKDGGDVLNCDLWQKIDRANNKNIEWLLVPGHAGHHINERCDEIAVAFSKNARPKLRNMPLDEASDYLDIYEIIVEGKEKLRVQKPPSAKKKSVIKKPFKKQSNMDLFDTSAAHNEVKRYLFAHKGQLYTFNNWPECKSFTDGRPGYPKCCRSRAEEEAYIKIFGLDKKVLDK